MGKKNCLKHQLILTEAEKYEEKEEGRVVYSRVGYPLRMYTLTLRMSSHKDKEGF